VGWGAHSQQLAWISQPSSTNRPTHQPTRYVESLIAAEAAEGVPSSRVVVAGFSQGGAVALSMLRSDKKLAGIVGEWLGGWGRGVGRDWSCVTVQCCDGASAARMQCARAPTQAPPAISAATNTNNKTCPHLQQRPQGMSTYLPLRKEPGVISPANAATPILQCHGDADQVVAYQFGVSTHNALKALGCDAELKTYRGMGHSAVPSELVAVQEFVRRVLPPV